jgi:hypothetical protein
MKQVADLLRRVWQASQPASETQASAVIDQGDRSSMADFVRILETYDRDRTDQATEIEGAAQAS